MAQGRFTRAKNFAYEFMDKHPEFKAEVIDYFELMKNEVEEGNSVENEIDLFIGSCKDLLIS